MAPIRPANAELRQSEYLTEVEVEKLIKAAKDGHRGNRDAAMILIPFRHGLRGRSEFAISIAPVLRTVRQAKLCRMRESF